MGNNKRFYFFVTEHSLREVKKTHKRTSPTSAEKFPDFCREVGQLHWSSFFGGLMGAHRYTRPLGPEGRVDFAKRTAGCFAVHFGVAQNEGIV